MPLLVSDRHIFEGMYMACQNLCSKKLGQESNNRTGYLPDSEVALSTIVVACINCISQPYSSTVFFKCISSQYFSTIGRGI